MSWICPACVFSPRVLLAGCEACCVLLVYGSDRRSGGSSLLCCRQRRALTHASMQAEVPEVLGWRAFLVEERVNECGLSAGL
jgi:hypothetical protein